MEIKDKRKRLKAIKAAIELRQSDKQKLQLEIKSLKEEKTKLTAEIKSAGAKSEAAKP